MDLKNPHFVLSIEEIHPDTLRVPPTLLDATPLYLETRTRSIRAFGLIRGFGYFTPSIGGDRKFSSPVLALISSVLFFFTPAPAVFFLCLHPKTPVSNRFITVLTAAL